MAEAAELSPEQENAYVIDAENAAEMARLMRQEQIVTAGMGGIFPEQSDLMQKTSSPSETHKTLPESAPLHTMCREWHFIPIFYTWYISSAKQVEGDDMREDPPGNQAAISTVNPPGACT